ncbi:hypothetical protein [Viridibacillus arvi]|uniref:hypothetical protein n=1 Tax=Viridibacillus arvi TaxID=263475 RepID=UPI003D05F76A
MNGSSKVLNSVILSGVLLVAGLTSPVEVNSKQTTATDNHSNITMVSASKLVNYNTVIDGKIAASNATTIISLNAFWYSSENVT